MQNKPSKNKKLQIKKHNTKNQISRQSKSKNISGLILKGILDVSRNGSAFVSVDEFEDDIMILRGKQSNALDGDLVKVRILGKAKNGRIEGEVSEVISRVQDEFIGRIEESEHFAFLIPESKKVPFDIFISKPNLKGAKNGDKVIVRVIEWHNGEKNPEGIIIHDLSSERDNQVAMKEILLENGFRLGFSKEAIAESNTFKDIITDEELAKRKDCRNLPTFTIDPEDAKDFDDAISFRPLKDDFFELGVHIADVSHFVREGSKLDEDAYRNATSVYLPDRVLPMLPENISNVLCSLRPEEDKYTFSVIFNINTSGEINNHWIGRTVIRSDKRYSYEEAQQIIEGAEGDFSDEILKLNTITQNLRKDRFKKGAINFTSQEIKYQLDELGKPIGIIIKESKAAHQLIEECMLLANRYVAQYIHKKNFNGAPIPFPYRVHPLPDEEKVAQYAGFARRFGYKIDTRSPEEIAESFNQLLNDVKGKPEEHLLQQLGIRTMAKALYTTVNEGHYGLGFENYCHFTSPIRRYPDVMVHRIIQQSLDKKIKPSQSMEEKCKHCSERERKAMEAERSANKYKQVEYMQSFIGHELEAIVSGVTGSGFWAVTVDQKCEGMVMISELAHLDEFDFIDSEYALIGRFTGLRFRIGDRVKILVEAANLETKKIDFGFIEKLHNVLKEEIKDKNLSKKKQKAKKK